jgi:hypothetical protein
VRPGDEDDAREVFLVEVGEDDVEGVVKPSLSLGNASIQTGMVWKYTNYISKRSTYARCMRAARYEPEGVPTSSENKPSFLPIGV